MTSKHEFQDREIDLYLFFDLMQVSKNILDLTYKDDIIILIGDTPSYLLPFLEKDRYVVNFAFSGKPFGCFYPPHFLESDNYQDADVFYTPSLENLNNYFDWLDTNTILTKDFVRRNWNNLVLVDSSTGQSITGVSLFFNRYVENIKQSGKNDVICKDVFNARPLQFIQLKEGHYKTINVNPQLSLDYFGNDQSRFLVNFNSRLIILIGTIIFYHRSLFMIYEAYPRIVPSYSIYSWDEPPILLKHGTKSLKKLRSLLRIYTLVYSEGVNENKLRQLILNNKFLFVWEQYNDTFKRKYIILDTQSPNFKQKLIKTFDKINCYISQFKA